MLIACLRLKASSLAFWGAFPSCYHSILSVFSLLFRVGFVLYFFRDLLLRSSCNIPSPAFAFFLVGRLLVRACAVESCHPKDTPNKVCGEKKGLDPKTRGTRFSPLRPRQKTTTTTTKPSAPLSLADLLHYTQRLSSNGGGRGSAVGLSGE